MRAFIIERYGRRATLRLADLPSPEPHGNEVLVQVRAAGVNALDNRIRTGEFKRILPYRLPLVLGHDVAGVVVRVGPQVTRFKTGDEVYARLDDLRIGSFAEMVSVAETSLAPKPARLTMEEAASVPLVGLTAWQALVEKARVKRGQKVFVEAGSGGVGTFAIQLARHLGAFVATTTSTRNVEFVKNLGADLVIDYTAQDFSELLRDYDVVLHSQDAASLTKAVGTLKRGGKLISISGPPDAAFGRTIGAPAVVRAVMHLLSAGIRRKAGRAGLEYSFLYMRADGPQLREITALLDAGVIRPVLDRVFPFEAVNEALAYVDTGRARGKVVVEVG